MGTAEAVIALAESQIGYREGRSADGTWNNIEKYVEDMPDLRSYQGQAWCATFVSWLALKTGMQGRFPHTVSCADGVAWWNARGRWGWKPQTGAQVFFGPGGGEHTGVVESFTDTHVTVISGNANDWAAPRGVGNSVHRDTYERTDPYVYGYGYPEYDAPLTLAQRIATLEATIKGLQARVR